MESKSVVPRVSWTEVYGNPFSKGLNHGMLAESGYVYATHARLIGNPAIKVFCQIHYDRKYVLAYLERKIIRALMPLNKKRFLKLMEAVWDYHERNDSIGSFFDVDESGNWTVSNRDSVD
ncbi:MAG: hypothetical protein ACRC11_08115 [Xenococcaceae cyanobacterium]